MTEELHAYLERRRRLVDQLRHMLIDLIRVRREPDEIDPDTPLFATGLGLDSIDFVDLVIGIDTTFGTKVADDRSGRLALRTINSIVDFLVDAEREVAHAR